MVKTTNGYAFRINHGLNQTQYVDWKYDILGPFVRTRPKISNNCYYFRTITHSSFIDFRYCFYKGYKKVIPYVLLYEKINPFILAVWIMDDGSKEGNQLRINSQSFSENDNIKLIELLRAKLGINSTLNRDKKWFRLRIKKESMSTLVEMI